jgi:capsular polysaccharide biosynthesis protein
MSTFTTRDPITRRPIAYEAESLRYTLRGVLRSWWIILIAAIVAVGAAVAYSTTRPVTYRTAAALLFGDTGYQQVVAGGYNPVDAQRRLRTNADMMQLPAVAERAARRLEGNPNFHPARTEVHPQYSNASNTMEVVASAADPRSAALLANATADAFLGYRQDAIDRSLERARAVLRRQIKRATTRGDRRVLVAKRNNLSAMEALDVQSVQLVQPAAVPGTPVSDETERNAAIALVLGLVLGVAIALLRVKAPEPPLPDPWRDDGAAPDPD